jgi:hypothetical protein
LNGLVLQSLDRKARTKDDNYVEANTATAVGYDGQPISRGTLIPRTTDGGANWTRQSSATDTPLYGVSFVDGNTGTAVGASGLILRTTDGGANWTSQSSGTSAPLNGVFSRTPKPGGRWVEQRPFSTPPRVASELEDLEHKHVEEIGRGVELAAFINRIREGGP